MGSPDDYSGGDMPLLSFLISLLLMGLMTLITIALSALAV
jgi:hypothetical protein